MGDTVLALEEVVVEFSGRILKDSEGKRVGVVVLRCRHNRAVLVSRERLCTQLEHISDCAELREAIASITMQVGEA